MASTPSFMTREQLAELVKNAPERVAIVDVRDEDYIGGHIAGAQNIPSESLDYRIPELVRTLKGKDKVVFHCALSQQRGPAAARRYMGEQEKLRQKEQSAGNESSQKLNEDEAPAQNSEQEVYVLQGGFSRWQEVYGLDKTLTEDYAEDLWRF